MKHEVASHSATYMVEENPGLRTSGNEGQASSGQNSTFFGELRKKATVPLAVAGVATGLLGAKMFAPAERSTDQEALNSLKNRPASELVLGSVEAAKAEGVIGEPAFKSASFPDVSDSNPYYEAITGMADAGIIGGFDDGTFGPDKLVTRQQFAKMIVGAMSPTVVATEDSWQDSNKPFNDLVTDDPNSLYPNDYVAVAAANGITQGKSPGKYAPYDNITRAQVDTMMVRAAKNLKQGLLTEPPADYQSTLGDFSPDHAGFLRWAEYNGLLTGLENYDPSWNPFQSATRGEVAQMLWNLKTYEKQTKQGADLVGVENLSLENIPVELAAQLKDIPNLSGITKIVAEDPVNAAKKITAFVIKTNDRDIDNKYFALKDGDNYALKKYFPKFTLLPNLFRTYLTFSYNPQDDFMGFRLGYPYDKQGTEEPWMYQQRMDQVTTNMVEDHGQNGTILAGEIKDVLAGSSQAYLSDGKTMFSYKIDQPYGVEVIKKLANSF